MIETGTTIAAPTASKDSLAAPRGSRRAGALLARGLSVLVPIATFGFMLLMWELAVRLGNVSPHLVPPVSEVVMIIWTEASLLAPASFATLKAVALGFGLSVVVGIMIAVVIVKFRPVERAIYPLLVATQVVPKVAIAPLFIVWFGFGMTSKVMLIFTIAFFPIVIDSTIGLKSIEREKIYLAQSMGASGLQTFVRFRLPNALPSIFAGLKLSVTLAVIGAVVAEFVGAQEGLGFLIQQANAALRIDLVFAGIGCLTIIGVLLFAAMDVLERLMIPWHVSHRHNHR